MGIKMNEDQATKSLCTAVSMYHAKDVLTKETEMMDKGTEEEKDRRMSLIIPTVIIQVFGIEAALTRIDHRFGNEGDFGRPERFSESFSIDPVQVE